MIWKSRFGAGLLGFGFLLSACATPQPTPQPPVLQVEASDLAAPLLADLAQAHAAASAGVALETATAPLSTLGDDLTAGRADLGLAATYDPGQFATPLGYVAFVIVVNPANPIGRLSVTQLRDIFAGRASDWGQVGGQSGVIQVVSREDGSDAAVAFGRAALAGTPPTLNALVAPTWAAMREVVNQSPAAIGYLPLPELEASVKPVALEVSLRALIVAVAPQPPAGAARGFLAWAQSEAGQAAVSKKYEAVRPEKD
jgi:ABC-type phosphate transport system substrate-binding protein